MKQTKNVPQLRFSGFDDEWENKEFSELFERRMERNNGQFGYDRWISVAKMYFQKPDKVTSNNIDTRTYVMRKSDIAFEGHSNKDYKLGRFVENDIGDGVISELFPIYKHIASYDLNYWKYAIQIERIMFPKLTKCIEISYTSSNKLDEYFFLKEHVLVPSCSEQKKIGTFISHVDSLIQAKTKKLESIKAVKKSLLQKCFPKAGEKVPEIRFAGFSGDWEESQLSELLEVSNLHNRDDKFRKEDIYSVSREFGVINQIEYQGKSLAGASLVNYKVVKRGNVVYTKSPLAEQPYGIIKANKNKDGIVSTLYGVYKEKDNCDSNFIQIYFDDNNRLNDYLRPLINKGAKNTILVSDEDALSGLIKYPSKPEQQKIGQFFSKYESLISVQQKEIDKLKNIKKSLLQKMFV